MNKKLNFLFDLNGTMINDMDYHISAWHQVLNHHGAAISWEHMKKECYGKNEEIVERLFPGKFTEEETHKMSLLKEQQYQQSYKPHVELLPGLHDFLIKARAKNIGMAIGSAAIMDNIDFIIDNLDLRVYFDVIVSADDVQLSKPHPETYLSCATKLRVKHDECIVFEDSTKGVESALNAGMKCIALTTLHEEQEFEKFNNVLAVVKDYADPRLCGLFFQGS